MQEPLRPAAPPSRYACRPMPPSPAPDPTHKPAPSRYVGPVLALVSVVLCMLLPMLLIRNLTAASPISSSGANGAVGATVALGALFRSGGRTMLRSTMMGAARTMARALTRRIVRSFLPMMVRLFLPAFRSSALESFELRKEQPLWVAMLLGAGTLGLSFYAVVHMSDATEQQALLSGLSLTSMAALATIPLVLHFTMFSLIGRRLGVKTTLSTDIDGILLQAYFTGALSYLPLASDVELEGDTRSKAICAAAVLTGFMVTYTVISLAGQWLNSPVLTGCGSQILLYAFVLSFPLPPLDGSDVWAHSRWGWLAIWLAILLTFLGRMPEAFYGIL